MADLINLALATKGLDLVTSPLALDPGALLEAKNVEWVRVQGLGGLGSRGALAALNTVALAGAVLAIAPIPLPSPADTDTVPKIALFGQSGLYVSSDSVTFFFVPLVNVPTGAGVIGPDGSVYYPSDTKVGKVAPDGTESSVDTGDTVRSVVFALGHIYVAVSTSGPNAGLWVPTNPPANAVSGRVIEYDPNLGSSRVIGQQFGTTAGMINAGNTPSPFTHVPAQMVGLAPASLTVKSGRLYVSVGVEIEVASYDPFAPPPLIDPDWTPNALLSIDPTSESVWTYVVFGDESPAPLPEPNVKGGPPGNAGTALGLVAYAADCHADESGGGSLGEATLNDDTSDDFRVGITTTGFAFYSILIEFSGAMYVAFNSIDSGGDAEAVQIYTSPDHLSNFTLDKDVFADVGGNVIAGTPYVLGTDLFWPMIGIHGNEANGYLMKRTSGGTWTVAQTGLAIIGGGFQTSVPV